jgi:hypothetical protein
MAALLALPPANTGTFAADSKRKGIRFWNLTSSTVTNLQLSPTGQNVWGPDQCANDPDGSVDHDGRYDVKLTNDAGTCVARNVEIKDNGVFAIQDKDLTDCRK